MSETSEQQASRLARIRARALDTDRRPEMVRAARWLRRRLPGDHEFGDPLSTAGDAPPQVMARRMSALAKSEQSTSREVALGALQAWQALSERSGRGRGTQETTLLFTDLVGFSSWALEAGDDTAVRLLREVGQIVEDAAGRHGGRLVKGLGDGAMIAFDRPEDALEAALEARDALAGMELGGYEPKMRFGIHEGRPRRLGGDLYGVDVNIAARVSAQAKPQQVLASEDTCAACGNGRYALGRAKKLKQPGAPRELRVRSVDRA